MTNSANPKLQQLLAEKLRPHADRVVAGTPNEFDYLPAALHLATEQDSQTARSLEAMATNLAQNDADTKQRLEEQSAQMQEQITMQINKLQADQKLSLENMATDLKIRDEGTQQRLSELVRTVRTVEQ